MYHLSVKPISRSAGRTATAAAAYRSGERIVDERTGETHDYTRKRDVVHREIVLPAGVPSWATDRQALWNAAEATEKRKDARVARDHEVAIPKELTLEQGVELVRDFSQDLVDRHGVAVDFAVHRDDPKTWDGTEKGWQGYHAHILSTTRKLGREGFGEKADPELSNAKRLAKGLCSGPDEIAEVRYRWEVIANRHLEQAGHDQRIDARSLKEQGVEREPTIHLGPQVTGLERRGISSRLGDLNRAAVAGLRLEPATRIVRVQGSAESGRAQRETPAGVHALAGDLVAESPIQALTRLEAERARRLKHAIQRSRQREDRRAQLLQRYEKALPARSSLTEQLRREWERAKARAAKLVEQARALTERLVHALHPRQLLEWVKVTAQGGRDAWSVSTSPSGQPSAASSPRGRRVPDRPTSKAATRPEPAFRREPWLPQEPSAPARQVSPPERSAAAASERAWGQTAPPGQALERLAKRTEQIRQARGFEQVPASDLEHLQERERQLGRSPERTLGRTPGTTAPESQQHSLDRTQDRDRDRGRGR